MPDCGRLLLLRIVGFMLRGWRQLGNTAARIVDAGQLRAAAAHERSPDAGEGSLPVLDHCRAMTQPTVCPRARS